MDNKGNTPESVDLRQRCERCRGWKVGTNNKEVVLKLSMHEGHPYVVCPRVRNTLEPAMFCMSCPFCKMVDMELREVRCKYASV